MLDGTEYFECQCSSPEHTLRFVLDLDSEDPGIHTEVYLGSYPWGWKRLWVGIRYILGYKSRYGAWDCFQLKPEDAPRLRAMLDRLPVRTGVDGLMEVLCPVHMGLDGETPHQGLRNDCGMCAPEAAAERPNPAVLYKPLG